MASSGPNNPALGASDSTVGAVAWSTPTNIYTSNNSRATAALNNQQSNYLKATNCSFAIPGGAVIDGIVVEIEKSRTAGTGTLSDTSVRLVKRGVITGQNRASHGAAWTDTDAYSTYGGVADPWGVAWTPSEVNAYDFGVVFSCSETAAAAATAGVDHVRITVYYTDGYVSGAQVQEAGEVSLFGQRYALAPDEQGKPGRVAVTLATNFPPKVDTGQYDRPSNPLVETYTVDDLRGGMGLWHYRDPRDLNRSYAPIMMETSFRKAITIGPPATSIDQPAAEDGLTRTPRVLVVFGGTPTLVAIYDSKLYNHDFTIWSALIDTLPGSSPTDSVIYNGRAFYALQQQGYSYQTAPASVAIDVGTPTFGSFAIWDSKLYGLDVDGVLYSSTTGDAASWTTLASLNKLMPSTTLRFFRLAVYDDANGDPIIYALTGIGPFAYDAVNDKWFHSRFQLPYWPQARDTTDWGVVYRGSLFFNHSGRTLTKLTMTGGQLLVEQASPGYPDGIPAVQDGHFAKLAANNDFLFLAAHESPTDASPDWPIYKMDAGGWHNIYINTAVTANYRTGFAILNTNNASASQNRLYFHDHNPTDGHIVRWIDLDLLTQNPLISTARTYATSGSIELPVFDAWNAPQVKIAQQARVKLAGASATETLQLAYRLNGSTGAYTNIGSPIAVNEEVTIPLGTNNTGITFRSWQWRWTLASAGSTAAPKIDHVSLDFVRKEEVQRGFQATLDMTHEFAGRTPQQQIDHLWVHMKAENFGTLAYRDDSDNVRSYLVKIMRPSGEEATGRDVTGRYTVLMVEMGPN